MDWMETRMEVIVDLEGCQRVSGEPGQVPIRERQTVGGGGVSCGGEERRRRRGEGRIIPLPVA